MLQAQQRLGDFEIIRLLGKGGMGEVYEARQTNPDRVVALKVLAPWLAENDDALQRFWREAEVPARLDHPNVVRIIASGKTDGIAWYAMQLVRGISLSDLMHGVGEPQPNTLPEATTDQDGDDPTTGAGDRHDARTTGNASAISAISKEYRTDRFRTAARIGVQAARALASAHRQGFLHRDIKPSNLMIDHHNQLYLVDFGLTRALTSDAKLTRYGVVVGTPWFMSPEQARGEPLDPRSDIFSLGVTLYQLASGGKGPYSANQRDSDAVLSEVRQGTLKPLRRLMPHVPPPLERVIMRAVEPKPERRYQTMEELADDLEQYLDPKPATRTFYAAASSWRNRPRPVWLGAGALLMAGLIGVALLSANRRPDPVAIANQPRTTAVASSSTQPDYWTAPRALSVREPLLRVDNQPREFKRLKGDGAPSALPTALVVTSADSLQPTLIALAAMPKQGFEYRVEVKQADYSNPTANELGLFFGFQEQPADPLARPRFFVISLDNRPVLNDIHGRLKIGTALLEEGDGALFDFFRPLNGPRWIPLAPPETEQSQWHAVTVRVQGQEISVTVDKQQPQKFDLDWMLQADRWLQAFALSPQGHLGLWVRNGHGYFRNVTLMALPGEESTP